MVTFYIVRHGQTLLNQLDRAQGWADSPLTALGEQSGKGAWKSLILCYVSDRIYKRYAQSL